MSGSIIIRSASADDAPALAALNAHVQSLHVNGRPDRFRQPGAGEVEDWFRARLAEPHVEAWIAEAEAGPVGYALVMARERPSTPFSLALRSFEIDQLAVVPAARLGGTARALVGHVRASARAAGASELILYCWVFNVDAHAAFRRMGLRPDAVRYAMVP